jgi:outer membrane receptor for ferrienterochelin and colicins
MAPEELHTDTDSLTTNYLDMVVVTATRTQRTLKDVPVLTKVISKVELNDRGAATALDALENIVPGLTFNPNSHGDNIQMQGLDNKYILVLLNGERMVNGKTENVNFSRLNISDMERIEIIDGAASVLYGSNAIGAVINIITKDVSKPVDIRAGERYSNFNTYMADASVGFKGERWSSKTSFNTKGSDGYRVSERKGDGQEAAQRVSPYVDYSVSQTFKYKFSEKINADIHGSFYRQQIYPYQDPTHSRELDYNVTGHLNWAASEKNALSLSLNADFYNAYTIFERLGTDRLNNNYYIYTGRLTDVWSINKSVQLLGGYEFNLEHSYSYNLFGDDNTKHNTNDHNVFAQIEVKLFKNFDLVVGGRLTHHSEFDLHATPKVSVMYKWNDFRFRAGVNNGFKAPTLKEMYYSFNMGGVSYIKGNPDLKPETSWYESVSIEYIRKKFNISVTGYTNDIKDKISTVEYTNVPGITVPVWQFENIDDARIWGIDVSAQANFLNYFNVTANYAFADTEDKSTGQPLSGASKHNVTGGLVFRYPKWKTGNVGLPFSLSFSGRVSSPRLYNSVSAGSMVTERKSKTASIWRIVYTQHFTSLFNIIDIELQGGVDNIFDWIEPERSINPGRTYFVGLKLKF